MALLTDYEIDADGSLWRIANFALIGDAVAGCITALSEPLPPELEQHRPLSGLRMRIPGSIGQGTVDFMAATPGLYVMRFDAEFFEDHRINVAGDRLIKIRVLVAGRMAYGMPEQVIDGAGAFLEAYPGGTASSYRLYGGAPTRLLVLHCEPGFFERMLGDQHKDLPAPLNHVFNVSSGPPISAPTPLGPDLLRAANDLFHAVRLYPPHLRLPYVDAKGREIGCLVLRDLAIPREIAAAHRRLSVRDVNRVYDARDVLVERFTDPPTIQQLARLIGLNQTKLKLVFKLVFGVTIGDFTLKCRMDRAAELLLNSELTISEIAYSIGYDHPANMTHAFKRHHGCAPRELRRATSARRIGSV